ncbi:hypothetical protein D187_009489 [Cystobacter fuscus DSM 2262]|uniref:Uncharacterized protein n=1 Tax=Cystobacter fuscus (strain ATCC 25194 / DSM 2262 / NBRC 100088 / M29) TaxID=1242864 RepID=S9NT32_CYSF2|nr:hypothetical protein D187_009489 [Cystobacter fuscus DSM 2262]
MYTLGKKPPLTPTPTWETGAELSASTTFPITSIFLAKVRGREKWPSGESNPLPLSWKGVTGPPSSCTTAQQPRPRPEDELDR